MLEKTAGEEHVDSRSQALAFARRLHDEQVMRQGVMARHVLLVQRHAQTWASVVFAIFLAFLSCAILLWNMHETRANSALSADARAHAKSSDSSSVRLPSLERQAVVPEQNTREVLLHELSKSQGLTITAVKISSAGDHANGKRERFVITSLGSYPRQKEFMQNVLFQLPEASLLNLKAQRMLPANAVTFEVVFDVPL